MDQTVDRRDCWHPGQPHQHGNRNAYRADRCRCPACRQANRRATQIRARALAAGPRSIAVDISTVGRHLQALRAAGFGVDRIATLSGVHASTVHRIVKSVGPAGSSSQRALRAQTATALLALRVEQAPQVDARARIAARPTHDILRHLLNEGHSQAEVAHYLGRQASSLRRTMRARTVTIGTAVALAHLAKRLAQQRTAISARPSRLSIVRRVGDDLPPPSSSGRYMYIMSVPERASRGSMKEAVGVHIKLTPEVYEQLAQAAAERGVSKRALLTAALLRELADPTLDKPQDTLYDVAS